MNKYLNLQNYLRAGFGLLNRHLLDHLERFLVLDPDQPLPHPPIFFVGAPRSGSTLMIQVITDTFDLGYISNRHCQWYGAPALAERLFRPLRDKPGSDYRSEQGATKGEYAPAECGQWWYRFFRQSPPYVTLQDVDTGRIAALSAVGRRADQGPGSSTVVENLFPD